VDLRTTRFEALRPGDWVTIKRATCWRVKAPDPLIVTWQGHQVRVRHDDPHLGPYTPRGAVIRSAMELASDVEGLRLYLVTTLGDRYQVRVADDGSVIGLWRKD
jgi:hypothetical protein